MMHSTDSGLDLTNDPGTVLVVFGIMVAIIWISAAPIRRADRKRDVGNDHDRFDRFDRFDRDVPIRPGPAIPARDDEPTDGDRLVYRHHGAGLDRDRDRIAGAPRPSRLADAARRALDAQRRAEGR